MHIICVTWYAYACRLMNTDRHRMSHPALNADVDGALAGEGRVIRMEGSSVVVEWDHGDENYYRWGVGQYDLDIVIESQKPKTNEVRV